MMRLMTDCDGHKQLMPRWFVPSVGTRLITHGLELWDQRPRRRAVVWSEKHDGRVWRFRLTATSFRYLLEYKRFGQRGGWRPGYCRWH